MKHTNYIWFFAILIILALGIASCGQSQPEVVTIGIINRVPVLDPVADGFKSKLAELGYVEGENVEYIYDGAITDMGELSAYAKKLVEADVDVILGITTPAAVTALQATSDIPIIFAPVNNPVEAGLVQTLTHPGGNVTGVTNAGGDPRRLQWLLEIDPSIKRVYVPYNSDDVAPTTAFASINNVAQDLNAELVSYEVHSAEENTQAIANISDEIDAIFLLPDDVINIHIMDWIKAANQNQVPISVPKMAPGAFMSYGFDDFAIGQQAGRLADQVLKGAKPGDLPVENAEFFLTINLETADTIGLEIPDAVLEQAHTLIRGDND